MLDTKMTAKFGVHNSMDASKLTILVTFIWVINYIATLGMIW